MNPSPAYDRRPCAADYATVPPLPPTCVPPLPFGQGNVDAAYAQAEGKPVAAKSGVAAWVRRNPWISLGLAALAVFLVYWIFFKKKSSSSSTPKRVPATTGDAALYQPLKAGGQVVGAKTSALGAPAAAPTTGIVIGPYEGLVSETAATARSATATTAPTTATQVPAHTTTA